MDKSVTCPHCGLYLPQEESIEDHVEIISSELNEKLSEHKIEFG